MTARTTIGDFYPPIRDKTDLSRISRINIPLSRLSRIEPSGGNRQVKKEGNKTCTCIEGTSRLAAKPNSSAVLGPVLSSEPSKSRYFLVTILILATILIRLRIILNFIYNLNDLRGDCISWVLIFESPLHLYWKLEKSICPTLKYSHISRHCAILAAISEMRIPDDADQRSGLMPIT
jgi:hypothetical protein